MDTLTNELWFTELKVLYLADFKSIKSCHKLLNPGWFSLIVVVSGTINLIDGSSIIRISKGDMSIVPQLAQVNTLGLPLQICLLSCTMDFAIINKIAIFGTGYIQVLNNQTPSVFSLEQAEIHHMVQLFGLLKKNVSGKYTIFQSKMVLLCIDLIFYAFGELYYTFGKNIAVHSPSERNVMGFIMLVQQNCKRHHDVKFYADSLFISKGHLRKIVRTVIGVSAKHLINKAVISEAYVLLVSNELSITEIGEHLNFSSSAAFSSFFKRHTKLSPTQYRQNLKF